MRAIRLFKNLQTSTDCTDVKIPSRHVFKNTPLFDFFRFSVSIEKLFPPSADECEESVKLCINSASISTVKFKLQEEEEEKTDFGVEADFKQCGFSV